MPLPHFRIKLTLPTSVDCENVELEGDSSVLIRSRAIRHGVLVLPGNSSFYDDRRTAFVRVSFSLLDDEETDEALARLAAAVREEWEDVKQKMSNKIYLHK
jgi:tryptophan aminotransferase